MKLVITTQRGAGLIFFAANNPSATMQDARFIKIASCPSITNVPVTNGKGSMFSLPLFFLLLNSMYWRITKTTKLILQIKAVRENNFIFGFQFIVFGFARYDKNVCDTPPVKTISRSFGHSIALLSHFRIVTFHIASLAN